MQIFSKANNYSGLGKELKELDMVLLPVAVALLGFLFVCLLEVFFVLFLFVSFFYEVVHEAASR